MHASHTCTYLAMHVPIKFVGRVVWLLVPHVLTDIWILYKKPWKKNSRMLLYLGAQAAMIVSNLLKVWMVEASSTTLAYLSFALCALLLTVFIAMTVPILQTLKIKFKGRYRQRIAKAFRIRYVHYKFKMQKIINRLDEKSEKLTHHHLLGMLVHDLGVDPEVEAFLSVLHAEGIISDASHPMWLKQPPERLARMIVAAKIDVREIERTQKHGTATENFLASVSVAYDIVGKKMKTIDSDSNEDQDNKEDDDADEDMSADSSSEDTSDKNGSQKTQVGPRMSLTIRQVVGLKEVIGESSKLYAASSLRVDTILMSFVVSRRLGTPRPGDCKGTSFSRLVILRSTTHLTPLRCLAVILIPSQ